MKEDRRSRIHKRNWGDMTKEIHHLIVKIPKIWREEFIVTIHNNEKRIYSENYRAYCLILLKSCEPIANEVLGEYLSDFRNERSTVDPIFNVRQPTRGSNSIWYSGALGILLVYEQVWVPTATNYLDKNVYCRNKGMGKCRSINHWIC